MFNLDGKTPPEDDSKEKSGESALKFESGVQSNTTLEGKVRCPPEEGNTCANDYEFDGESYFYKDLKTDKNKLILVKKFQASFKKTFFLQGHLKHLVFLQDFLSILALYPLMITEVSSLLLVSL